MYILSTAKLNAVGHWWVGELALDFKFDIRYIQGKANADADVLSRWPLDIDKYVTACTEVLTEEVVQATWDGSQIHRANDVAWVVALNARQEGAVWQDGESAMTLDPTELRTAQREDPNISELIKLKERHLK
ncbi:hypothetical protein QQF64_002831 [Cirrhinus molitorella]|uniref:Reverse transcriptase RNase H-like domain-containing protein n=1 Tax=Cirrhinus molitorella TaxID=172907 RepID=A0ABR3MRB4_9TELE